MRAALTAGEENHNHFVVMGGQRVSTSADADLILVLDKGQVVGQGTHQELLATNKVYQSIVNSQIRESKEGEQNA